MRGISFKQNNNFENCLYLILGNINIIDFTWLVDDNEAYKLKGNKIDGNYFEEKNFTGHAFKDKIKNESYYIIFLKLFAFQSNTLPHSINSYKEFLDERNCKIAVLLCDNKYVDIYCKEVSDIEKIKQNAAMMDCSDIQYITDENDNRVTFEY